MKINEFWVPEELAALNKEKSKPVIITYETSKNIGETLIRTSEEFWSAEVYGKMATFYISENIFSEQVENEIVEEIQ